MGIHSYDLKLTAYLQERHSVSLEQCAHFQERSVSSVKRSIAAVNEFLPRQKQIQIEDNQVCFHMTYQEYLDFIQSLTLADYYPSQEDRLAIMVVYLFFNQTLNTSHLYEILQFSPSTKKNDSRALSSWLSERNLHTVSVPKIGLRVQGSEQSFRVSICDLLSQCVEVDRDYCLVFRKANNPMQNMMVDYVLGQAGDAIQQAREYLLEFLRSQNCRISYSSLKFLYLYLACALYRQGSGCVLQMCSDIALPTTDYRMMELPEENKFLNHIISALDFKTRTLPPFDQVLGDLTRQMIAIVQEQIITWISDDHLIYEEVYAYLHKCVIRNTYHFSFYDNKLEETQQHYSNLYEVLTGALKDYESVYDIRMDHYQISTLTLIFRKFVTRNKLAKRNRKKLIVVTNSSVEKIEFFMEKLRLRLDVELVDIINISELYLLEHAVYDHLIVFSNRIATLLKENGYACIKLHFYLLAEDFALLEDMGFSTSHRKLKAKLFVETLLAQPNREWASFLLDCYGDFFLE